jgi:hypothetical protein
MIPLTTGVRSKAVPIVASSFGVSSSSFPFCSAAHDLRYFSSKQPPRQAARETEKISEDGTQVKSSTVPKRRHNPEHTASAGSSYSRFKNSRKKEWRTENHAGTAGTQRPALIQPTVYLYDQRKPRTANEDYASSSPHLVLRSISASAMLDPFSFCKSSGKNINGADAARRLLRGKKDFLVAARSLRSPVLLQGHGVPQKLLQHCVDMADALLYHYGDDIVACTFHNYHQDSETLPPQVVRTRSGDSKNRCSPWPPPEPLLHDWDYHLTLYLTVMRRLACNLGMVLQGKSNSKRARSADDGDSDDFMSSPLLFPSSPPSPQWNVDFLRGAYYDLKHDQGLSRSQHILATLPIVEFTRDSRTAGHVLIRLQGSPRPNPEFHSECSRKPVTLVFDACFRNHIP